MRDPDLAPQHKPQLPVTIFDLINQRSFGINTAAAKDKMDFAVQIAVGSSIQVALFVAPVLVFASMLLGNDRSLDLHLSTIETWPS